MLNTKVYSNAFTGMLSPVTNDNESGDARTVLDSDIVDLPLRPVTTPEVGGRATSNTTGIGIDSPELGRPVQNLGVTQIIADCQSYYTARSDGELSLKMFYAISNVQRISRSRYGGRMEDADGLWGQFDRENVQIEFKLRHPLKVRAVETFSIPLGDYISYRKGEIFTVDVS
jgi:hypothetical protein